MVEPARGPASYRDVLEAPPGQVAELVDGVLHLQPRPAFPHGHAASVLGAQLLVAFHLGRGGPGGWWIQDEPELHLGRNVLVPDVGGWRIQDLGAEELTAAFIERAPAWVLEVLSPSTASFDRINKLALYHQAGVEHAWLVDPQARTLEVFARQEAGWLRVLAEAGDATVHAPPFEALALDLATLWPTPRG